MKIIESSRIPSFYSEDGIYVVLPMKDPSYMDCAISIHNGMIAWRYVPSEMTRAGSNFVQMLDQTLYMFDSKEKFLRCLMKVYPKDFEFFLWHPEAFEGNFYGEYHDTDTISPIDPSVLLGSLSVGQNTGA